MVQEKARVPMAPFFVRVCALNACRRAGLATVRTVESAARRGASGRESRLSCHIRHAADITVRAGKMGVE
jgi:hypothetical protein